MHIRTAGNTGQSRVRALIFALALVFVGLFGLGARAETSGMLRVKLTRLGAPKALTLMADCDYYLASDPEVRIPAGERATLTASDAGLALAVGSLRKDLGDTAFFMRAEAGNRGVKFLQPELSNRFCGDLGLSASGGVITAILNIYVENYLYGVVGYAMSPSAGLEALKAEAVAARTWALRRRATRGDAVYDLTDSGDQVFKGYSNSADYANVVRAVDETEGGALYYRGSLAQCAVCASNGGQTESSRNAGGPALDYSVVRDDPYDYESKTAAVKTARINKDLTDVEPALRAALVEAVRVQLEARGLSDAVERFRLTGVESITACESRFAAPSRLYKSLTFKLTVAGVDADGAEQTGSVSVSIPTYGGFETWYDLSLNPEDNETVWVVEGERAFNVSFRRSGSGVGLSLRGAQVMAEKGMRASEILAFYFPGTEARKLQLRDTTQDSAAQTPAARGKVIAIARLLDKTDLLDAPEDGAAAAATAAAGAVVAVYGVPGEWVAVGSSGKYGYIRVDSLKSFTLSGAEAERAEGEVYGRAQTEAEVLRLPVREAQALGTLEAGEIVRVQAWTEDWAMVEWSGQNGFVALERLEIASPGATPEVQASDPEAFVDVEGALNARLKQDAPLFESANELSSTLENLKAGDVVQVLAYSRDWARVKTRSGRTGCLRQESIAAADGAASENAVEGGEIHRVKGKKYMYVTAALATVYATWSEASEALETVIYGEAVRVGAYNDMWICVRVNGQVGYVRAEALSETRPAALEGGSLVRARAGFTAVVRRDTGILDAADIGARRLASLERDRRVTVEAYNAAWALVRADDVVGFARLEDLEKAGD